MGLRKMKQGLPRVPLDYLGRNSPVAGDTTDHATAAGLKTMVKKFKKSKDQKFNG